MAAGRLTQVLGALRHMEGGVSDAVLLERFVRVRDETAFELLVWRHQRLVFGVCRRLLDDVHDAEDAFQATFLVLARKAGAISSRQAVAGWLYRVAYRVALTARSRRSRRAARQRPLNQAELAVWPDPDTAERRDLAAVVGEEVNRLPARFRAAAVLCYLEGRTVEEAARQLGCPRGTVASRLARARDRLRSRLARRGLALTAGAAAVALSEASLSAAAPDGLITAAVRAAGLSGPGAGVGESARVVTLCEEVLRAMFVKKAVSSVAAAIVLGGVLFLGGSAAVRLRASAQAAAATAQVAADGQPGPKAARRAVTVGRPVRRDFAPYEDFTGRLALIRTVDVRPRVAGVVEKVHVKVGDYVKKGDLLFLIGSAELRAALEQARANLDQAEARLKLAAIKLVRLKQAFNDGVATQAVVDQAAAGVAAAQADRAAARATVEQRLAELEEARVLAPVAGRIGERTAVVGDSVTPATVLARIPVLDPIGVNFDVDERTVLRYRRALNAKEVQGVGGPLAVGVADEKGLPHRGTLDHIDGQVNPNTGTLGFHGVLPNPGDVFLPGMSARVRLPLGKPRPVLEVPERAVHTDQGKRFVLVVDDRGVLERRDVTPGARDGGRRVIEAGLRPEDRLVTDGGAALQPGDRVEPRR
jgi:RND family efflux transporter MFP subunit